MVSDLVEFLRAALDEDEQVARVAAHGGRWRYETGDSVGAWTLYDEHWNIASMTTYDTESYNYAERMPAFRPPTYIDPDAIGSHIARHDPAQVLAEVKAKRAILDGCVETLAGEDSWDPMTEGGSGEEFELARFVIRQQAQPYAGRPGWREEWAT
jgi:hypothetical protein